MFDQILQKAAKGNGLDSHEALTLLNLVSVDSPRYRTLVSTADRLSRKLFHGMGEVHGQIGLNWGFCSHKCSFCVFCTDAARDQEPLELSAQEIVEKAKEYETQGVNSIALMGTANYNFDRFLDVGRQVSRALRSGIPLVANCGDIGPVQAKELVKAGYLGFYHAIRLREGTDTSIKREKRIASILAARRAGLFFGSCIEPIGPEHTAGELVELMTTLRELGVGVVAVMKRVNHPGTALEAQGEIDEDELARVGAITRLFFGKSIAAFAAHEPNLACLRAGANIVYSETGPNPRDHVVNPPKQRGRTVDDCLRMLQQANLKFRPGSATPRYVRSALRGNRPMRRFFFHFVRNSVKKRIYSSSNLFDGGRLKSLVSGADNN